MTAPELITLLVTITLIEMMIAIGLGVNFADLSAVVRNWRLVTKAFLSNYLCVPVVTVGLLLFFHPADAMISVGFLILAVCPGAPFGPGCTAIAKGNVASSVGLMVLLAGTSALAAPCLLFLLLPFLSENDSLKIDAVKIVLTLLITQLIPLAVGLGIRYCWPGLANWLQKPANRLSAVLNLLLFTVVLTVHFQILMEIRLRGYCGMLMLLAVSLGMGWLLGGPSSGNRKALSLTTSLRNVGVGLVIATGNFGGTAAVTAVVAYGIIEIVGSLLLAIIWGRQNKAFGETGS